MIQMNEKYIEQILNIYNHVDTIILTDDKGYITYFITIGLMSILIDLKTW